MFCSTALVQTVSSALSRGELIKMHSPWWKSQGLGIPNLLLIQSWNFMWYGQAVIEVLRAVIFKVEQQHMHTVNSRCLIWKSNAYNPIKRRGKEPRVKLNSLPCSLKPFKTSLSRPDILPDIFMEDLSWAINICMRDITPGYHMLCHILYFGSLKRFWTWGTGFYERRTMQQTFHGM